MPRMMDSTSVAANATSANVLAGLLHEIIQFRRAAIRIAAATTATGVRCSYTLGERQIVNDQLISFANRMPDFTTADLIGQTVGVLGQRQFLTFRNTTGGALVPTWVVDVERV
jgi:hypothetical protein